MKRSVNLFRTDPLPRIIAALGIGIFMMSTACAQTTIVKDAATIKGTTVVIPGKEYKRSGYHNFFWGKHYRKEWNTAVRVNNFYLDTAKGGLTPIEKGGGRQSSTLRLKDKKGKEYVLRSVNKDFGKGVPSVRGTFLAHIAKDQVSIGHPFTGPTITPMSEAAGVYHTSPVIVFVPSQKALGEFDKEFGDQLYLFEERPDDDQSTAPNFGYSKNVIGTDRLMEHIYDDNDDHVDQTAFVRARLFDMVIGDWGRHPDNWRWASFEKGDQKIYRPIPRDRDQAYTKIDGLYPSMASMLMKHLQGFDPDIKDVGGWNFPGRPLDRMFLNELSRETWVEQAKLIQKALTDDLISYSIRQMPPEEFAVSGEKIIATLKSRRDHLVEYANDYYEYLTKSVDLAGTDGREWFQINRISGKETEISIYKISKEGKTAKTPYYSRRFSIKETKEVRLYGLGKEDLITVKGPGKTGIKIRLIDPGNKDSIVFDRKHLHNEIAIYSGKKFEYDTVHEKKSDFTVMSLFTAKPYRIFERDPLKLFTRTGLKITAGLTYNTQPWRKEQYEVVHHVSASYGFLRNTFNAGYVGRVGRMFGKWDMVVKARIDAPAAENYFGVGNNSVFDNKTRNYYRTYSNRFYASAGVERNFASNHHLEISAFYRTLKYRETANHFIGEGPSVINPTAFGPHHFAGLEAGYRFLNVNDEVYPTQGVAWTTGAGYTMNVDEKNESYVSANTDASIYIPLGSLFSMALRAGGATMSGKADFFNLNKLGGGGSGEIRAFERERFYGKHTAYAGGDLRWIFNTNNYIFNGKAGLLGFYDVGRVWLPGESSDKWHGGYGFGVIVIPYNKYALTGLYGISPEGNNVHFKVGLLF